MKKALYLSLLLLGGAHLMSAQTTLSQNAKPKIKFEPRELLAKRVLHTGLEATSEAAVPPSAASRSLGLSVGVTTWDVSTNGAVKPRLVNQGNGKLSAAFVYAKGDVAGGMPERGTGYNTTDANGKFGSEPTKRTETQRTGYSSMAVDTDGNEYLFAHKGGFKILMTKKLKGQTTWTETEVPTSVPGGVLWCYPAIGGANGKTIHLLAITAPTGTSTNGKLYQNINGAMVYFRSKDGGITWDKKDILLPGIDSTRYNAMDPDGYSVTAKGDKVAIGAYSSWNDNEVWISDDNGDNFMRKTVFDFPLNNYKTDQLYNTKDIPPSPSTTDSLIISSTDGAGITFIDNKNNVHVIVGAMNVKDDIVDQNTSWYPFSNGLYHWTDAEPDSLRFIDAYSDADGDGTIPANAEIGSYFVSLTSHPTLAQGADGKLYLAYSGMAEDFKNDNTNTYCRHIYMMYSSDFGKTWSAPYDLTADTKLFDTKNFLQEVAECTFPYFAPRVDDNLHLLYQMDYSPHWHITHPSTITVEFEDNYQVYTAIPTAQFVDVKENVAPKDIQFALSPNPTNGRVRLDYNLEENADVTVVIFDVTGRLVANHDLSLQNAGKQSLQIDTPTTSGLYLVRLQINGQYSTQRLVVE